MASEPPDSGDVTVTPPSAQLTVLDLTEWTRLAEVDAYAARRGISRAEAIRLLVNQGLSYE